MKMKPQLFFFVGRERIFILDYFRACCGSSSFLPSCILQWLTQNAALGSRMLLLNLQPLQVACAKHAGCSVNFIKCFRHETTENHLTLINRLSKVTIKRGKKQSTSYNTRTTFIFPNEFKCHQLYTLWPVGWKYSVFLNSITRKPKVMNMCNIFILPTKGNYLKYC